MTSSLLMRTLTAVLSAGLALAADNAGTALSGPRLGLVFDPAAGSLRPIAGIPGAAITGDALRLGYLTLRDWNGQRKDERRARERDSAVLEASR